MKNLTTGVTLGIALALAGCGNDAAKTENVGIARTTISGLVSLLPSFGKDEAEATPIDQAAQQAAIARSALELNAGPVMLVSLEATNTNTAAAMVGENGSMRTYNTPAKQSLVLRNGLLAGTRGFGNDVMSARIDEISALILGRQAGTAVRTPYYLDGEGIERPLPFDCTVSLGAEQSFAIGDTPYTAMQVAETCTAPNLSITNSYLVTADRQVVLSRQWIAPTLGYVTLQTLRP
jgi:hypothetical protein